MLIKTIFGFIRANGFSKVPPEQFKCFKEFKRAGIVPELLPRPPPIVLKVSYRRYIELGHPLQPNFCLLEPNHVHWKTMECHEKYTVMLLNPDYPDPARPLGRSYQHWIVVNMPGDNFLKGDHITPYIGPTPQRFTPVHRFVFLVYKQREKIKTADIKRLNPHSNTGRTKFNLAAFIDKHHLFPFPEAGTFFIAEYDEAVHHLEKKLAIGAMHEEFLKGSSPSRPDPCKI